MNHLINDNNYAEWVDRFLDAGTTLEEERELYIYFSRPDLPPEAEKYRPMFSWYSSLPCAGSTSAGTDSRAQRPSRMRILPLKAWQWASVAAMIVVLFAIGFNMRSSADHAESYYSEGYILRDGQRITDIDMVLSEIERAEMEMNTRLAAFGAGDASDEFEAFDRRADELMTAAFDMSNPDVRDLVTTTSLNYY